MLLPSNEALLQAAELVPGLNGIDETSADDFVQLWSSLPEEIQRQMVSVMLYHVIVEPFPTEEDKDVATALTVAASSSGSLEFLLKSIDSGAKVQTGTLQKVEIYDPFVVCDNTVYYIDQLLVPTLPNRIPETSLEDALTVFIGLGAPGN